MVTETGRILSNIVNNKDLKIARIATEMGISSGNISRLFNGTRQVSVDIVLAIVRYLAPDQELALMSSYCREVTMPHNLKLAMEYLSTNRLLDELEIVINKSLESSNVELKEFAELYTLLLQYIKSEITAQDLYKKIRGHRVKFEDSCVMLRFLELYSLYEQKQYNFMLISAENLQKEIESLSDAYLKSSYSARLGEMLQYINLKVLNAPNKAREITERVIESNIGKSFNASAMYIDGLSYIYEDIEKCLSMLDECKKIYKSINKDRDLLVVELTIEFIKVLWGVPVDYFLDLENKAFSLIKNGQLQQGLDLLDSIEKNQTEPDPFRLYIRGIGTNNPKYHYESLKIFKQRGDIFFANMPKIKLIELGEKEYVLDAILV